MRNSGIWWHLWLKLVTSSSACVPDISSFYPERRIESINPYSKQPGFCEGMQAAGNNITTTSSQAQNFAVTVGYSSPLPHGQLVSEPLQVELENKELWEKFHAIGTEMIITKNGR